MADEGEVEVCRSFRNTGRCRFGEDCKFEHSEGEPIAQPERRERGECFNWRDSAECMHGDRCRFSHGPDDTRGNDRSQEVCRNFLRGRCANGDECVRKHEGEPRPRRRRQRKPRGKGVCFAWRDSGDCERGEDCQFAHGEEDTSGGEGERRPLRQRKPRPVGECYAFRDQGECERGEDCQFTHGETGGEGGERPQRQRKPRPVGECYAFRDQGECERGEDCRFVHGPVAETDAPARKPRKPRPVVKLDEICNNFKANKCRLGDRCRRIHEEGGDFVENTAE